ncbi:hypothetical protein [Lentibacillus sp.]|uniref:hypothetical protein n=1 Tax=Lentibacillus sp. TaxID=1925746 RepID=UPI002B4B4C67|nr:hypothetical protein [Lentibacillus sp.]HLS08901.1 hypothetical protein [Lentibacillus sp.]
MQAFQNATDVRKHWGQFNDDIVRKGPQFVKRNRDEWAALSKEQLHAAFGHFRFDAKMLTEDDGSITASIRDFGMVANGDTEEKALTELAEYLIDYAEAYQEEFELYYKSPNRRDHFPYIMNVLIQDDTEDVKALISCRHGER